MYECMYDFDGFCDDAEKGDFCLLAKSCLKSLVELFARSVVEFLVKSLVRFVVESLVKSLAKTLV